MPTFDEQEDSELAHAKLVAAARAKFIAGHPRVSEAEEILAAAEKLATEARHRLAEAQRWAKEQFDASRNEAAAAAGPRRGRFAFGDRVRRARVAAGLSQSELARRARTTQPTVARTELGKNIPSVRAAVRLAAALGTTVEALCAPVPAKEVA